MIDLIVLDVDGCLSDGKVIYTYCEGKISESKNFNAKDGLSLVSWHGLGKKSAIITGRTSKVVEHRANELGITYCIQGVGDKLSVLKDILSVTTLDMRNVAMVGDDLNDYKLLKEVGYSFCPNDANKIVKDIVDVVLDTDGGCGVVSEMMHHILKRDNLLDAYYDKWI